MEGKMDQNLRHIASKINAQVLAVTTQTNESLVNELMTLKLPHSIFNKVWLETAYLGVHLLQKKFSVLLGHESSKTVNIYVRELFLDIAPGLFGGEGDNKEIFKEWIVSQYDQRLEMYEQYQGLDISLRFRELIRNVFNTTEGSKVRFIENKPSNHPRLKTAFFFGGKKLLGKHENEVYLPNENLNAFAANAAQAFSNISEHDIKGL
jgi:hypothetical protein